MASRGAEAHIVAQERLRGVVSTAVETLWDSLPAYNEQDSAVFVAAVVPLVLAAQRQSVALTETFLAGRLGRLPVGVTTDDLVGSAVRNGAAPAEVYHRSFVTVWSQLADGVLWADAVAAGKARAAATAQTDVQLSMRATLRAVAEA